MKLKNKNVTVMGLGQHGGGEGLVRFLSKKGANVLVTDLKNENELQSTINHLSDLKNIKYYFGPHSWSNFKDADIVYLNPAVPKNSLWVKKIKKAKIPISSEMNLFFELCPALIIGVTGSNGKSTTVHLIYEVLKSKFEPVFSLHQKTDASLTNDRKKVYFGGNIGGSLLQYIDEIKKDDIVLLELSSFQLYDLNQIKKSPHIGILLNITPDHMDQHSNIQEYIEAKKNIFKYQSEFDFAILNYDQNIIRKIAKSITSQKLFFSLDTKLVRGAYLDENQIIVNFRGKKHKIIKSNKLKIKGEHNIQNALPAVLIGVLYGIDDKKIAGSISNFRGLEHRIEFVNKFKGVKYYNDSKSTTPESTIAALKSFEKPIILICGGKDKKIDYKKLANLISKKVKNVYLIGETAPLLKKEIDMANKELGNSIEAEIAHTLEYAFEKAKKSAQKGDIILFSPATSSFDQFQNFEERGKKFKKLASGKKYNGKKI